CLRERSISFLVLSARMTLRTSLCCGLATLSMFLTQPVDISETCRKPFIPPYWSRLTYMPCEVISLTVQTTISPGSGMLPCSEVIIESRRTHFANRRFCGRFRYAATQSSFFTTVPRILAFPPMLSTSFLPHDLQPT